MIYFLKGYPGEGPFALVLTIPPILLLLETEAKKIKYCVSLCLSPLPELRCIQPQWFHAG